MTLIFLLLIIQLAAIVIINLYYNTLNNFKKGVGSLLKIDLNSIDGPHMHQTTFFAVTSTLTFLYLLFAITYCCAKRIPVEDVEEEMDLNGNVYKPRQFQRKFSRSELIKRDLENLIELIHHLRKKLGTFWKRVK